VEFVTFSANYKNGYLDIAVRTDKKPRHYTDSGLSLLIM